MSVKVRCHCGYSMELPDEWSGRHGRCPQCGKVLQIPDNRAAAPAWPVTRAADEDDDRSRDSAPREPDDDSARPLPAWLRSPAWFATIAGGIALCVIGLIMLLSGPSATEDGGGPDAVGGTADTTNADGKPDDLFRPTATTDDDRTNVPPGPADTEPPRVAASKPAPPPRTPAKIGEAALSLDAWNTYDFGIQIPRGATTLEIDGVALPVRELDELAAAGRAAVVLPLGRHIVRFARNEPPRVVEPKRWFLDAYREATEQVKEGGRLDFDRLLDMSRRTMDRFTDPLVPHLWGNYYWQERQLDAAARHYVWALSIAPTFAPSYFNLAQLAHDRGDDAAARRFLRLAELWNVQNAFGLAQATVALGGALDEPAVAEELDERDWLTPQYNALSARDRDMTDVLRSAAEFAPRVTERAKILNNLGAYFEHEGKPELAMEHYRAAASVFASATLTPDETRVIRAILENLARLCRKADMPEYRRYERLQAMVK